ncbi:hypothetical protein BRADI_5g18525v3 [Brachypodium distachyon]|uniref:Uncharacterized protein n=1 Tax=Brachypodium distachyon TaxID=15368 RepID=A0A2K2CI22_BRADI|nr:hypothetical protein BRADI_5g18525v3 [Brachypodium distachyon]
MCSRARARMKQQAKRRLLHGRTSPGLLSSLATRHTDASCFGIRKRSQAGRHDSSACFFLDGRVVESRMAVYCL